MRTYSFWLNPTGHSKFHNTLNIHLPATDLDRTACTLLYPPLQAVPTSSFPHPFYPAPEQRNWRKPVPVPVTGVCYNSLFWMCTLNTLTWPNKDGVHYGNCCSVLWKLSPVNLLTRFTNIYVTSYEMSILTSRVKQARYLAQWHANSHTIYHIYQSYFLPFLFKWLTRKMRWTKLW